MGKYELARRALLLRVDRLDLSKNIIRGYEAILPDGLELNVEEIVYLDGMSLFKLVNAQFNITVCLTVRQRPFDRVYP